MAVLKTRWSMLILEDHPDLRETLQSNFDDLFAGAIHLDFAASICQAVDKIKRQMQAGDPYDVFWIDLYLDYFSYDNDHGEIVSVDSFSQIIDTAHLQQTHRLTEVSLSSVLAALRAGIRPLHKPPAQYSDQEKLHVLELFRPYCQPLAQSSYETFLELVDFYVRVDDYKDDDLRDSNVYARHVLDYIFRRFAQWAQSPKEREFSLNAKSAADWRDPQNVNILPNTEDKSDQSWTIFHAWARQFYNAVAAYAKGMEEYTAANPLLLELKQLAFNDYPQFLINTAYSGRRQELVKLGSVWSSDSVIITHSNFKGEKKNAALLEYTFRLFRHLRRPYLVLKSRRQGSNAFVLKDGDLAKVTQLHTNFDPHQPVLVNPSLRLAFTAHSFLPEWMNDFKKLAEVFRPRLNDLVAKARHDLETDARSRKPQQAGMCRLHLPARFLDTPHQHESFQLEVQMLSGKWLQAKLSFDEGRWAFLELACRLWFPKCFFMHSTWKAREGYGASEVYFSPADKVLARAVRQAAKTYTELFPPLAVLEKTDMALPPAAAFYQADGDYISAFDWDSFLAKVSLSGDGQEAAPVGVQAKRLLCIAHFLMAELHIHRFAQQLLTMTRLTPASLCDLMAKPQFDKSEESCMHCLRQIERAPARIVIDHYLPGVKNLIAVTLCFHTLPAPEVAALYGLWQEKDVPLHGVRPIEKFSAISKKLEHVQLVESRALPMQTEDKKKYLFIPCAFTQKPSLLLNVKTSSLFSNFPQTWYDLATVSHQELLQRVGVASL
jgi:hypothetical protein